MGYIYFAAEEDQDLVEIFGYYGLAFFDLHLHEPVNLVLTLDILFQFNL